MLGINIMNVLFPGISRFMPNDIIRLVVIDDNKSFRDALCSFLDHQADLKVVAEAENGRVGVEKVREHKPDVVLMDISMPLLNGIDATRMITAAFPEIKVIVLSMHDNEAGFLQKAYEAGACQYFSKTSSRKEILAAIHRARSS
jgi:DNA-binding NarL/FixJ family response regulator